MQYRHRCVRRFCAIWVACEGSFVGQTMAFRWGWNSLDRPSNPRRHVWPTNLRFSSDNLLLFFHLFSLLLNFYASPFKFHSSPSICFFYWFDLYSFDYDLFYLKLIIKSEYFFNFIPFQCFYWSNFVHILLIAICFIEIIFKIENFLNEFILIPILLIAIFFFDKFSKLIFYFLILFFNIKLIDQNWASW